MEDFKKKMNADMNDKEIVFSKSIKAGKRIYYLDVKKNRKDEMFLASNPQLSSSASFLRLNVLSSLN